jgi:hypothetical protein
MLLLMTDAASFNNVLSGIGCSWLTILEVCAFKSQLREISAFIEFNAPLHWLADASSDRLIKWRKKAW